MILALDLYSLISDAPLARSLSINRTLRTRLPSARPFVRLHEPRSLASRLEDDDHVAESLARPDRPDPTWRGAAWRGVVAHTPTRSRVNAANGDGAERRCVCVCVCCRPPAALLDVCRRRRTQLVRRRSARRWFARAMHIRCDLGLVCRVSLRSRREPLAPFVSGSLLCAGCGSRDCL